MWGTDLLLGGGATPSRHLVIAGTGRAGTSFLVRYMTALGLDTTLSRQGDSAFWDESANAGLEENLATADAVDLPYVVKWPWLFESIEFVLRRTDIALDAVLVPIRDLVEAATSRAVLEQQAVHKAAPRMVECERSWETWGITAGGILYSLNPLDEGRLLAVGLHRLLEQLAAAEVPVVLLAFPRLVQDPKYLYRQLRPWLPSHVTEDLAVEAHRKVADPAKVRVTTEIGATATPAYFPSAVCTYPKQEEIDHIALRREVVSLRQGADHLRSALSQAEAREAANAAANAAAIQAEAANVAAIRAEAAALREEADKHRAAADKMRAELAAARRSYSWRLTKPLRALANLSWKGFVQRHFRAS